MHKDRCRPFHMHQWLCLGVDKEEDYHLCVTAEQLGMGSVRKRIFAGSSHIQHDFQGNVSTVGERKSSRPEQFQPCCTALPPPPPLGPITACVCMCERLSLRERICSYGAWWWWGLASCAMSWATGAFILHWCDAAQGLFVFSVWQSVGDLKSR